MIKELAEDMAAEKAMQESAKEARDDEQYGKSDKTRNLRQQIKNLKSELKDMSEEYTRYQMLSQGLGFALESAGTSDNHTDTRGSSNPLQRNEEDPSDSADLTENSPLRSERVRQQLEYDKALVKAVLLAEQMAKGNDKLHKAHMSTVTSKFNTSKKLQMEKTSQVNYRAQLAQDLRDI